MTDKALIKAAHFRIKNFGENGSNMGVLVRKKLLQDLSPFNFGKMLNLKERFLKKPFLPIREGAGCLKGPQLRILGHEFPYKPTLTEMRKTRESCL